jgi:hypothetical protein
LGDDGVPHTVAHGEADKSYRTSTEALQGIGDNGNETGSEIGAQRRGNVEYWHKNGRIKVARFFGKVPKVGIGRARLATDDRRNGRCRGHHGWRRGRQGG